MAEMENVDNIFKYDKKTRKQRYPVGKVRKRIEKSEDED